jgi:hypothetical protein
MGSNRGCLAHDGDKLHTETRNARNHPSHSRADIDCFEIKEYMFPGPDEVIMNKIGQSLSKEVPTNFIK